MTLLNSVTKIVAKKRKVLGRGLGSGKGVKSGRGTTRHQKARTTIPLAFEGGQGKFVKRYPLLRGKSKNKSIYKKPFIVALEKLNSISAGTVVSIDTLIEHKLVDDSARTRGVKIVNKGKLNHKLTLRVATTKAVEELVSKMA